MEGFVFQFPWFSSVQTPAFAINYYFHGTLSFFVVQCFKIIVGGKLGTEAHNCIGINSHFFFLIVQQKAHLVVIKRK